jgi:adenosylhomocysteine nucleosidase
LLKIVVTFAVWPEFAPWRRMAGFEALNGRDIPTFVKRTRDAEIYAVITGVGARSMETPLRSLLSDSTDICIASGLAGSARKQHCTGAVLVAKSVKGSGPERVLQSDKFLVESARHCGAVAVDCFLTSNTVVNSPADKSRIGQRADAVDMESFHILRQAEECGIPAVAVRAISDAVETELPIDFNRVIDDRGQIGWAPALFEIAKSPQRVPELIRFGIDSSRARRNLAHFLDRLMGLVARNQDMQFSRARAEMK